MRVFAWTVLAIFCAASAFATPSRSTSSEDQLVAATQDRIFVLRTVRDNLGSYYSALVDQHLVEIDIDEGEVLAVHPLRHMRIDHLAESEDRLPGKVTERPGETSDMNAILREAGAEPITPFHYQQGLLKMNKDQLWNDGQLVLTNFGIRAAARGQLAPLREIYPPLETEEDFFGHKKIDFYNLFVSGNWSCSTDGKAVLFLRSAGTVRVAKLTCEIADTESTVSFHVFVPDNV